MIRQIRIKAGTVGLLFRRGEFRKVLTKGLYWIRLRDVVYRFDLTKDIRVFPVALELLLEDEKFASMLHVIEVQDGELVVVTKNGLFSEVLTAGRYTYWKGIVEYGFNRFDITDINIPDNFDKAWLNRPELARYIRTFEIAVYEKAVLLVDDVYEKTIGPGVYRYWRNDTTVKFAKVDMRQLQLEVAGQELLTRDKAAIRINFDVTYKVTDVEKAMLDSKAYEKQLYTEMQLALRNYVGGYTLDELLERKAEIAKAVFEDTKAAAIKLGVKVLNCGLRDIILTGEMRDIMNQVLVAQKKAQANVITRREETASTRSLLNTAKLMEDNEMLYKLKEMEFVEKIAEKIGEISISGNGGIVSQLKEILQTSK